MSRPPVLYDLHFGELLTSRFADLFKSGDAKIDGEGLIGAGQVFIKGVESGTLLRKREGDKPAMAQIEVRRTVQFNKVVGPSDGFSRALLVVGFGSARIREERSGGIEEGPTGQMGARTVGTGQ
jgi:hypothetical protein